MRYFLRVCLSATSLLYGANTTADTILIDPSGEVNGKVSGLTQEQKPTSLVDEILGGIASSSKISEQLIAEQAVFVELSDLPFVKMPKEWQARGDVFNDSAALLLLLEKSKIKGKIAAVNRTKSPVNLLLTKKVPDQEGSKPSCLSIAAGRYKDLEISSVDAIDSISVDSGYLNVVSEQGRCFLTVETEQPLLFPRVLAPFRFVPDLAEAEKKAVEYDERAKKEEGSTYSEALKQRAKKIREYVGHIGYLRWAVARDEWVKGSKEFGSDKLYLPLYKQRESLYADFCLERMLESAAIALPLTPRIPLNLFSIWLTNQENPVEPKEEYIDLLLRSAVANPAKEGWSQYFVVQDFVLENSDLFKKTREKLAGSGVTLTSYEKLIGKLELQDSFDAIVTKKKFAKASDLLRVEILHKLGGGYLDIDLLTAQSLKPLFYMYDSLFGLEPMSEFVGNAFMAARVGHPVMREMLDLMARNFRFKAEGNTAFYSASVLDEKDGFDTILQTGPCSTTVAFFNKAGTGGNRDILMPPEMFYPSDSPERPEFGIPGIDEPISIAAATHHLWRTTWAGAAGKDNGCNG